MRQTRPDTHTHRHPHRTRRPDGPPDVAGAAGATDPVSGAACGYWRRRGLPTAPDQVVAAPTAALLLLALLAACEGGDGTGCGVVLPRPGPEWHAAQARLLGRPLHRVPVSAECGGVPDSFALLETVSRARAAGGSPRLLLLSVADDVTGTAAPPELLHEACEAAAQEGLLVVGDESLRNAFHDPHGTVPVSPAEILHGTGTGTGTGPDGGTDGGGVRPGPAAESTVVLVDLGADPDPGPCPGSRAGVARLPATAAGRELAERTRTVLAALGAALSGPAAAAAAGILAEPEPLREHRAAANRAHGTLAAALHRTLTRAGAVCRPPQAGRHLYPDFEALRPGLAARGVTDALRLEAELVRRLGPYALGGHRFGDDPHALRVRLSTDVLTRGVSPAVTASAAPTAARSSSASARGPAEQPGPAGALARVAAALAGLATG
ncbi:aminotransferase class I/II-fold pyridoxal phosphate-dependent enzyme [Streptomyces sp. TRM 70361]|uniref:aminotransferase class I/II-fold pyridoxal phosphate-dependent enzyme n=1 Tax=Streptomyces sp. TRM 70361 TaxID=3116553 RepID=UPI002E7C32DF|nr:aminotransferase class I/II-fold pyridoxal phosphate-dependent enzyme [Streptomyces sp. TRM 70361]MEE1941922.1 aminotransferase class I/II-fold pyridoxal phosphate-dependent enzyme [Streptomyces sp. TRM 70361]